MPSEGVIRLFGFMKDNDLNNHSETQPSRFADHLHVQIFLHQAELELRRLELYCLGQLLPWGHVPRDP